MKKQRESYDVDVSFDSDKAAALLRGQAEDESDNEACDARGENGANSAEKDAASLGIAAGKDNVQNDENGQNKDFIATTDDVKTSDAQNSDVNKDVDDKDENSKTDIQKQEWKFGKFTNPQELYKAYLELEKEFTRRSQRLKELEGKKDEVPFGNDEEFMIAADKFFESTPSAKKFARDIAEEIYARPELKRDKNCFLIALCEVMAKKFRTPQQLMEDGQFVKEFVLGNEKVKDAIIGEYLEALRLNAPPKTMQSGGMQCVAPSTRPKSVEEAGWMFLRNNK